MQFYYTDLFNKLQTLQPDLWLDSSDHFHTSRGNANQAAVGYLKRDIVSLDRGYMPEYDEHEVSREWVQCTPHIAALTGAHNRDHVGQQETMLTPIDGTAEIYKFVDELLGSKTWAEFSTDKLGADDGDPVPFLATRYDGYDPQTKEHIPTILLRMFFVSREIPGPIKRLGWRRALDIVIRANVPNITRESVEKLLNVDLSVPITPLHIGIAS